MTLSSQIIGLIAQLVGALHRYHRVISLNPVETRIFFQGLSQLLVMVDYISVPQFQYMNINKQKYAAEYNKIE